MRLLTSSLVPSRDCDADLSPLRLAVVGLLLALAISLPAVHAQDATIVDSLHYKVQFENDDVRVIRVTYGPGERSPTHAHPEGMLVFLTGGEGAFSYLDAPTQTFRWEAGEVEWVPAMVHRAENTGTKPYELLFIEVKGSPAAASVHEVTRERDPIIDVHLHAYIETQWNAGVPNPATGQPPPATAEAHMRATLAAMDELNVVAAIVSGPLEAVEAWRRAAPERVLASPLFGRADFDDHDLPLPTLDSLRTMYDAGLLKAMAEITAQYEGLSPSDMALDPYFTMAEQLGIPVGIHTGTSFPGTPYFGKPNFRVALGNPLLLEDLLVRHPDLRVYIMHGGEPWRRETVALMEMYPQVYMDVAVINWIGGTQAIPRFHAFLREMIDAGLGERIMFGTDQMRWPEAIGMAIEAIESAEFLSAKQKRDILYNNAARFLGLSDEVIARHHGR